MAEAVECPLWLDLATLGPRQTVLLALLEATCTRLERAGVPCWITGGTLVGALRHEGFIPHDDDIDLECLASDSARLQAAFEGHGQLDFRCGGFWGVTRVAHVGLRGSNVELDIFLREEPLEEMHDFPSAAETFPLRPYTFHGLEVPGPAEPLPFLSRLYGPDWALTVKVWSHDFNEVHGLAHDPERVTLPLAEYNALVAALGYQAPEHAEGGLEELLRAGGPVELLKVAREASWLEKLQRRNREQAEARLRLQMARDGAA